MEVKVIICERKDIPAKMEEMAGQGLEFKELKQKQGTTMVELYFEPQRSKKTVLND